MSKKDKEQTIQWYDAVLYSAGDESDKLKPTKMETVGELVKETDEYIILKNTQTKNCQQPEKELEKDRYTYIPKGMIEK